MTHGFLARSLEFDQQWQSLARRVRLVRYDHRNHGRSDHSTPSLTIEQLGYDLADVIEQLAPTGDLVLLGHSMGGMTVMSLAQHRPDVLARVTGVALLATGAGHSIDGHRIEDAVRMLLRSHATGPVLLGLRLLAPVLEHLRPRRTHVMRWATRRVIFGTEDIDPATVAQTHQLLEEPPLATLASLHGSLLRNDTRGGLERLRGRPVAVVTGSDDRLTRPEHSRRIAADLGADAELLVIPGTGHVLNQTRPIEVNAALHRLLDRCAVPA
jgi:pimeloyl-ACP methyl ester carboxylesterase